MITIRCVVERITYQNPENGYSVIKVNVKGKDNLVTVVGNLLDVNVGSVLIIEGNWKANAKFGSQFVAEKWEETLPATIYGIEKYLGSGLIRGIGPKFAKRIVSRFGTDTLDVIEQTPDRLNEIEGIGEKRVARVKESWEKQKEIKNIMIFLQGNGVSTSFAAKIFKTYGPDSIKVVKENPYRLADDIWGIGFKTADTIAEKLGFTKDSLQRCRSGIFYTLNQLGDDGHVFAYRPQLIEKAIELLDVPKEAIVKTLETMLGTDDLKTEDDAIYLPAFYHAEVGVANRLKALNVQSKNANPSVAFERLEKATGFEYDEVQREAILQSTVSKVMILTGGPGTGKTTTTLGIIKVLASRGKRIVLAAPTGRAAKRMTEATGLEAKTIHRLLEFKPPEGYQRNEENKLEGDCLIIDESSMIDIVLMNSLLKAIPNHMQLILVGDIDQLPSVGAGNVLRDLIDSGVFPVVRLTKIFRQAQSSRIITNAHKINKGEFPDITNQKGTDFFFIGQDDPAFVAQEIVKLVQYRLPKFKGVKPEDIQVLTPMQRGDVGASNLNLLLQTALNQTEDCLRRSGYAFKVGDKVMQIKNNYDKEVFNGDIGIVSGVDLEERVLTVTFENRNIEYEASELDELVHAYAITIHKSQGSEYPIVVMPIMMTHYVMLQRNLIYTGITRAKKLLVLIGQRKAIAMAVRTNSAIKRNTMLAKRVADNSSI